MPERKRRLVAYLRVSTIEQKAHGFGLDVQRRAIREAARALDARVVQWCSDEGLSGALPAVDRPGLTEALDMIAAAEEEGLIVMVGCMVSSSLAMAPAFVAAQRAQYADIDGPLLLARDRLPGLMFSGSIVHPPYPDLWG